MSFRAAWALFQEVEGRGGMAAAIRTGFPQETVDQLALERIAAVESRRDGIVGTNLQPNLREKPLAAPGVDYEALADQRIWQVNSYRLAVDPEGSQQVLNRLYDINEAAALKKMQRLSEAFSQGATLGGISKVLRAGRGDEPAVNRLCLRRRSESFERLRRRVEAHAARTGGRPKVFLANLGPRKQHAARADFSTGFFAAGGFEVLTNPGFGAAANAAAEALASGAAVVVICSTDDSYPQLVPPLAAALKAGPRPPLVVLAGLPATPELQHGFRSAGIDEFIHLRANCAQVLARFLDLLGI